MAKDFKLFLTQNKYYDIGVENGIFITTDGLDTALYMSIFGETRALAEEISDAMQRRGHPINEFNAVEGYEIGSKMWLYTTRTTNTLKNTELIRIAIKDALQQLIDDNIVEDIKVSVIQTNSKIQMSIELKNTVSGTLYYDVFINTFV